MTDTTTEDLTPHASLLGSVKLISSIDEIKMGLEVVDVASGLRGIISSRNEALTGQTQYSIQPLGNGSEIPGGHFVDWQGLAILGDGVSKNLPPIDATATIQLGEVVKDSVTGFQGTAYERVTFKNGCVYFFVQPPLDKKKPEAYPESVLFPHARLSRVSAGVSKTEPPKETAKKAASTGGPSRPMSSFRRA